MSEEYQKRNRILKELGYLSYDAYLRSPLWRSIRARVLAANPLCWICDDPATEPHHMSYTRAGLMGTCLKTIISICHYCHRTIEYDDQRNKLDPSQAAKKAKQLRRLREIRGL